MQYGVDIHVQCRICGTEFNLFVLLICGCGRDLKCFSYSSMFLFMPLGQKACVEIDVARGAWRDVSCGEYRPFICKKIMGEC